MIQNLSGKAFYIYGANTAVGKTFFSSFIAQYVAKMGQKVQYIKPFQTGYPSDSDARAVQNSCRNNAFLTTNTLWAGEPAVSPHRVLASDQAKKVDDEVLAKLLQLCAQNSENKEFTLIEGAGGVASPTCSGVSQANFFRKLLLPVILIGDSKLGGISATIAAAEYLKVRGYEIALVLLLENEEQNCEYLQKNMNCPVLSFSFNKELESPHANFEFEKFDSFASQITDRLIAFVNEKEKRAQQMLINSPKILWWPFTQHSENISPKVIESATDDFYTLSDSSKVFDASASWWTQSLGHGNAEISTDVAFALGRYGHVLYPEHVHEPAFALAEMLLAGVGAPWAQRVFYTDNGSTAVEVALKMAFRWSNAGEHCKVLGLLDSYHGDTLGAMNASSKNVFNCTTEWYEPKGVWLNFPEIIFKNGKWKIDLSRVSEFKSECDKLSEFEIDDLGSVANIVSLSRRLSGIAEVYFALISKMLANVDLKKFGALLIEPVVHGSAGMIFVDPVFQFALCKFAKQAKIPVIFDEVFTGFWRLGSQTAAKYIGMEPDISCFSKALTGGVCPLGVTLAREEIFDSFKGATKKEALLHGHSYTAYAAGCAAAVRALKLMQHCIASRPECLQLWDKELVNKISHLPKIKRAFAMGTLFVAEFSCADSGYASGALKNLVAEMNSSGIGVRPLGNVIYFLGTLNTSKEKADELLNFLIQLSQ